MNGAIEMKNNRGLRISLIDFLARFFAVSRRSHEGSEDEQNAVSINSLGTETEVVNEELTPNTRPKKVSSRWVQLQPHVYKESGAIARFHNIFWWL
jgi:hypothetical protein